MVSARKHLSRWVDRMWRALTMHAHKVAKGHGASSGGCGNGDIGVCIYPNSSNCRH